MAYFPTIKISDIFAALKSIINLLNRPIWMNSTTGAIRLVDTVTTVTGATVGTVSTVTSMTQIGGIAAYDSMIIIPMKNNWANSVRPRISDETWS